MAGCQLEVPRSPPILYRLKFLILGFCFLSLSFSFWPAAGWRFPNPLPILYCIKFLIFGFPLSLFPSFCRLPAGSPKAAMNTETPTNASSYLSFPFPSLLAGCRLEVPKVPSYYIPPQISDFWLFFSFVFWPAAGWRSYIISYFIPPQISDFWFSSLFLSFSFCRLPAGCPKVPSYSIPPQISDFWFSSLFLSFSFCRLPAGSPKAAMNTETPTNASSYLSFPFPSLLAASWRSPQYPPIIYGLKFLIFGFPLFFFPLSFGRLPAGVPKVPSYSIPPQISDFWFSFSLLFPCLLAGCWLEVPRHPPIIYRLKFLIFGFPLSLSLSFGRLPAGGPKFPPILNLYRLEFLIFGFPFPLSFGRLPAGGPKLLPSYSIPPRNSDFWLSSLSFPLSFGPLPGWKPQRRHEHRDPDKCQ